MLERLVQTWNETDRVYRAAILLMIFLDSVAAGLLVAGVLR